MKPVYNIVLFTQDKDNDKLLISVLIKHYERIAVVQTLAEVSSFLREDTPKVILVAGEKFQDTLSSFYSALDKVHDNQLCEHFFVSLVSKHNETEAYEAYRSGIIDDYIVSRPLYEIHRPIVICDHLLVELGVAKYAREGLEHIYKQEKYDEQVRKIVAKGLERKEVMLNNFESSLSNIEHALDDAADHIQKNQAVELDLDKLKATLSAIKSDQVRPELLKLQAKALSLLQKMVGDVNEMAVKAPVEDEPELQNAPPVTFNNLQETGGNVEDLLAKADRVLSVLLVEDDPISIHLTSQLMTPYKIDLETAFTGRRALACIKNRDFDVVFLDINLPDTSGLYILDQITGSNKKEQKSVVIMLTGNKNKSTALKAIELGARGYIVKPMRKENFLSIFTKFKLNLAKK